MQDAQVYCLKERPLCILRPQNFSCLLLAPAISTLGIQSLAEWRLNGLRLGVNREARAWLQEEL